MPEPELDDVHRALSMPSSASSDFDLDPEWGADAEPALRRAAVLVGILSYKSTLEVLLTKRSSALRHHPGQIAFPGGKLDDGDADHEACALREAQEEVGLPASGVDILGRLPSHRTVTGFDVVPVVCSITHPFEIVAETGEVAEVFSVPLAHVSDMSRFSIQGRRWRGQTRRYYTVPYGPYYIWGATARMLYGLAQRLGT